MNGRERWSWGLRLEKGGEARMILEREREEERKRRGEEKREREKGSLD
jgi:hypothetical protein